MTISLMSYIHAPFAFSSSMKQHRIKAITAMKVEIQSRKLIKPSIVTPPNLRRYNISFIDELAPEMILPIVLFYPPNPKYTPTFVAQLEESLAKTLTLLYPLAGRYVADTRTVDCNDQGVEFIKAQADIALEEILEIKTDPMLINKFIPSKMWDTDHAANALLATQITKFPCGGIALGISIAHRIGDVSSVITFINQWATLSQKDMTKVELCRSDFTLSSLFPAQGLPFIETGFSKLENRNDYVTKKVCFNESAILNMKAKVTMNAKSNAHQLFKVRLVSALIWKAFIGVDHAISGHLRASILIQPVALRQKREKITSLKPKNPLGNQWGIIVTKCDPTTMMNRFEDLSNLLVDSVTKTIKDYSKVGHDSHETKQKVLNSLSEVNIIPDTTDVVWLVSWCKFPFYDVDFGFEKPAWVSCGFVPFERGVVLMDDAKGNGIEAYVTMKVTDVPYFEQDEDIKTYST